MEDAQASPEKKEEATEVAEKVATPKPAAKARLVDEVEQHVNENEAQQHLHHGQHGPGQR